MTRRLCPRQVSPRDRLVSRYPREAEHTRALARNLNINHCFFSSVFKAFLFGLLVFAFHVAEDAAKGVLHGENMAEAFQNMRINDLLRRSLVIGCTFVPFFAFREVRRVLGEEKFQGLFFFSGDEKNAIYDLPDSFRAVPFLANQERRRIVGLTYAMEAGIVSSISVPQSSLLQTSRLPPTSLALSCMPCRPQ